MKKKILKTTLLLMMISAVSKVLSFFIRILIARQLTDDALSYYSLASSALLFLIALSNFGIPNALTQLVASKKDAHSCISAAILVSLANNFLLCLVCLLGIPLYARFLLKQEILIPVLYACVPMLPMVMLTGLLKGYFTGKQKMLFSCSAQITEELFRLVFLIAFFPSVSSNPVLLASFAIFSQTIGEIGSCLHLSFTLLFHSPKKVIRYILPEFEKNAITELLSLSVPMTASRMCGSLTAFLEPVVMLNAASTAMKDIYIQIYSSLNSYLLPLITLPSFFSIAISGWVLPAFSEAYGQKQSSKAKSIFLISTLFTFLLGIGASLGFYFFSEQICRLLYHKTDMAHLLKVLSLPFSIYSVQPVLLSMLHGAQKSKRALANTFCGCVLRLVSLFIMCSFSIPNAAIYSLMLSSFVTTLLHFEAALSLFIHKKQTVFGPQRYKNI